MLMEDKKKIFSGMRPTGRLHYGHIAGALINWSKLQEQYDCFFGIVDWHALMSDYADSSKVAANCREVLLDWLAVGIDPNKAAVFIQSHVKQHVELHMALSMITPLGWLERCPTYKEQIINLQNKDLSNYAFLGYPVLMAADIMLYKSFAVPVGEDQGPHLELTREIVRRFNHFYGEVFPEPQILLTPSAKMPGTDGRKMSKSYDNSLEVADDMDTIWNKLRTMMTDPARERRTDPGTPEKCPVWDVHKFFNKDIAELDELHLGCTTAGIGCIDCKKRLMVHVKEQMEPIQERRRYYEGRDDELKQILTSGAARARAVAARTMDEVYYAIGLVR